MSEALERRSTPVVVEVRAAAAGRVIGGYAAKFDRLSQNLGGFVEKIDRGFFNKSRGDGWPGVIARYNHNDDMLLGTAAAGTLRLDLDEVGLLYEVDLPEARADVHELVARGDVRQSSFAFGLFEDDWGMTDDGFPLRTLIKGRLYDVAPVNTPAYEDTTAALRSLAHKFDAPLEDVMQGDLVRFFKRTDTQQPKRSAQAAAALAQVKRLT